MCSPSLCAAEEHLSLDHALQLIHNAEILMQGRDHENIPLSTLSCILITVTRSSAFDGEFLALHPR